MARNQPIGDLSKPPVDELTDTVGGKYQLVIVAAKRARQITAFRTQVGEGLLEYTGPLVTPRREREQPLSIALREIHQGVLKVDTPDYL